MLRTFERISVYCGSSSACHPDYLAAARDTGAALAARGIGIVFGGGRVGMMGAVADGAIAAGGEVIGVIPDRLMGREVAHPGLSKLYVVPDMHSRKTMMAQLADGFIALPGGWGTLEELFEVLTWSQLNYHMKPVGLLNSRGYYDQLLAFLSFAAGEAFIRPAHQHLLQHDNELAPLLEKLARVEIPNFADWKA